MNGSEAWCLSFYSAKLDYKSKIYVKNLLFCKNTKLIISLEFYKWQRRLIPNFYSTKLDNTIIMNTNLKHSPFKTLFLKVLLRTNFLVQRVPGHRVAAVKIYTRTHSKHRTGKVLTKIDINTFTRFGSLWLSSNY